MKISRDSVIYKQLSNLPKIGLNAINAEAIEKNAKEIVQLNRDQMRAGIAPDGKQQAEYESGRYADYKITLPTYQAPTPVADLFLHGPFQEGMYLKIEGKDVKLFSTDEKAELLNRKYQPFGLTPANMDQVRPKVTNYYFKEIHAILNE